MAIPPKIGGTLFEVICAAGAQRAEHLWMVFSRLAQPPVVGVPALLPCFCRLNEPPSQAGSKYFG